MPCDCVHQAKYVSRLIADCVTSGVETIDVAADAEDKYTTFCAKAAAKGWVVRTATLLFARVLGFGST